MNRRVRGGGARGRGGRGGGKRNSSVAGEGKSSRPEKIVEKEDTGA